MFLFFVFVLGERTECWPRITRSSCIFLKAFYISWLLERNEPFLLEWNLDAFENNPFKSGVSHISYAVLLTLLPFTEYLLPTLYWEPLLCSHRLWRALWRCLVRPHFQRSTVKQHQRASAAAQSGLKTHLKTGIACTHLWFVLLCVCYLDIKPRAALLNIFAHVHACNLVFLLRWEYYLSGSACLLFTITYTTAFPSWSYGNKHCSD